MRQEVGPPVHAFNARSTVHKITQTKIRQGTMSMQICQLQTKCQLKRSVCHGCMLQCLQAVAAASTKLSRCMPGLQLLVEQQTHQTCLNQLRCSGIITHHPHKHDQLQQDVILCQTWLCIPCTDRQCHDRQRLRACICQCWCVLPVKEPKTLLDKDAQGGPQATMSLCRSSVG